MQYKMKVTKRAGKTVKRDIKVQVSASDISDKMMARLLGDLDIDSLSDKVFGGLI